MKFQPKRFVVEVKRGTSRAAFASPDATADKFGDAEAALFGRPAKLEPAARQPLQAKSEQPAGRILRSLVEPPPPPVPDFPEPARRGRKPGSKNKPKTETSSELDRVAEPVRRGRKPGSRNKPKVPFSIAAPEPEFVRAAPDTAALMRSYGFAEGQADWEEPAVPNAEAAAAPPAAEPVTPSAPRREGDAERVRTRLRDRSTILRRYVLAVEPGPGQPGAMRSKRRARAGR